MLKRMMAMFVLVSAVGSALPRQAVASDSFSGRITNFTATSVSVRGPEVLTVTLDSRTIFTKLITQKPWQEDTRLNARSLSVGRLVVVHVRDEDPAIARWVQIATDMPSTAAAAPSSASFAPIAAAPVAQVSKSSDLLTAKEVRELIANAKTPADHVRLQKHYLASAARYDAEAAEHTAEAAAYRKNPSFMDSKHPGNPGTASHCDRFAELSRAAAKEARDLAAAHEQMAAAK
jgi:hypothetical protein